MGIHSYLKRSDTPQDSIEVWRKCQLCFLRSGIPDDMRAEAQTLEPLQSLYGSWYSLPA